MKQSDKGTKTVFVTGASGKLGKRMSKELLDAGYAVRALAMGKELVSELPPGVVPFLGNLHDTHVIDDACNGADAVIHLAAVASESSRTEELVRVNVEGTKLLLDACKKNGVKHLIFSSTTDVYGRKRNETLKETTRPLPTDRYGHSKLLAEQEIVKSGVPYTILRIAAIYGPGFEKPFFKVFRALREGKVAIIGQGNNHLALVHIDDVISAVMLAMENPERSIGKIYNVSDGDPHTQEYLIDMTAELLGVAKPRRHVQEFVVRMLARQRNLDSDELRFLTSNRVADISKIKAELGFRPGVEIRKGLGEMVGEFLKR